MIPTLSPWPDILLDDGRPEDACEIVRVLIRTREESFAHPVDPHDRNFDFWHDRWQRYLEINADWDVWRSLAEATL